MDWSIQRYHVDFAPEEDCVRVRKGLLKSHKNKLGHYIYDGTVMYTCVPLPKVSDFMPCFLMRYCIVRVVQISTCP